MIRRLAIVAAALIATPAAAQVVNPGPNAAAVSAAQADAAKAQADAATAATAAATAKARADAAQAQIDALAPQVCPPANTTPKMENVTPSAGTAPTCRRSDDVQPRSSRAGVVTSDTSGNWSITFTTPAPAVPVVIPIPINATTQPVTCNVATRSAAAATGRCWLARSLPATLTLLSNLVAYDVFGAPASGITVQILAIPPSQ